VFHKLAPSLGFKKGYTAQGDMVSKVARVMAAEHAACKAAHINFCIMPERPQPIGRIDELAIRGLQRVVAYSKIGRAHALEHAVRLSTIAFALASNPITLFSWTGEKFVDWTDEDPPIDVTG
jgi:microsomal epoxide hydrolase